MPDEEDSAFTTHVCLELEDCNYCVSTTIHGDVIIEHQSKDGHYGQFMPVPRFEGTEHLRRFIEGLAAHAPYFRLLR